MQRQSFDKPDDSCLQEAIIYFLRAVIAELKASEDKKSGDLKDIYLRKLASYKIQTIIQVVYTLPKEDGLFLLQQCKDESSPLGAFCKGDLLQYIEDNVDDKRFIPTSPALLAASRLFARQQEEKNNNTNPNPVVIRKKGRTPGF